MPPNKNEALNKKARDKFALYKSQARLRVLLNKKYELLNQLTEIGEVYSIKDLIEGWDMSIEKEAKVLLFYAQFIEHQNDMPVENKKEICTKQISLNNEKLTEMI